MRGEVGIEPVQALRDGKRPVHRYGVLALPQTTALSETHHPLNHLRGLVGDIHGAGGGVDQEHARD